MGPLNLNSNLHMAFIEWNQSVETNSVFYFPPSVSIWIEKKNIVKDLKTA